MGEQNKEITRSRVVKVESEKSWDSFHKPSRKARATGKFF